MEQCSVCFNLIDNNNKFTTDCFHSYCKGCLTEWMKRGNKDCPMCRGNIVNLRDDKDIYKVLFINSPEQSNNNSNININLLNRYNRSNRYLCLMFILSCVQLYYQFTSSINYTLLSKKYEYCMNNITDITDTLNNCQIKLYNLLNFNQ
jgi:hypothetical protein